MWAYALVWIVQLQCAKIGEHNVRIIETSTRLVDIPYGDYFSVEDRWTIVPSKSNPKRCKLFIELKVRSRALPARAANARMDVSTNRAATLAIDIAQVVFSKSTIWKGKIESRAIADNKTKWLGWAQAAKQHLADQQKQSAGEVVASPPLSSEAVVFQTSADSEQPPSHRRSLTTQSSTSSTRATASKRRSSRASSSHKSRSAQATGHPSPSPSFILYLRGVYACQRCSGWRLVCLAGGNLTLMLLCRVVAVFPWILVLGLLFLVVRMQSSLANIEQTLVLTSTKVDAIESRLAALSAACPANTA